MVSKSNAALSAVVVVLLVALAALVAAPPQPAAETTHTTTQTLTQTETVTQTVTSTRTVTTTETAAETLPRTNITVHFIDVGQGDSIFIDTLGEDVLIDGGKEAEGAVVVEYLTGLGVTEIDIAIATHPDADHIGGLITVMQAFDASGYSIHTVLDNGQEKDTATYRRYRSLAEEKNKVVAERGQTFQLDDVAVMTVLNPAQPLEFTDYNDNSVVVRLEVNEMSFLFTGDLEASGERSVLRAGLEVSSTVLKVGHHGSRTATTQEFLSAVDPYVAVISAGSGNPYGHPHKEVLDRLKESGISTYRIYRTDIEGTIVVTTDGIGLNVATEHTCGC